MYLVSFYEEKGYLEASLGGRVTAEEVGALGEELRDLFETSVRQPFAVLLDYSRAKRFDSGALAAMSSLQDLCVENGACEIISLAQDAEEAARHQTLRLQGVLEGRESYVASPSHVRFRSLESVLIARAA